MLYYRKNKKTKSEKYIFGLYTTGENNTNGEVFVDDISIYRIDDFIKIAINNNRDEDMIQLMLYMKYIIKEIIQ